jgi:hypothetical protein
MPGALEKRWGGAGTGHRDLSGRRRWCGRCRQTRGDVGAQFRDWSCSRLCPGPENERSAIPPMFIRLMLEKKQPIVVNLGYVLSIAPVGPRATIKLIDCNVLTVEHSFDKVCDLMARLAGEVPAKPVRRSAS